MDNKEPLPEPPIEFGSPEHKKIIEEGLRLWRLSRRLNTEEARQELFAFMVKYNIHGG